jgi:hypothetical protein
VTIKDLQITRKRTVEQLRDEGIAPIDILQITGHKNVQSILNYSTLSEKKNIKKCPIFWQTLVTKNKT